ncbi:MAG: DNA repair protein RecO [Myxococcota bacterium]
MAEYRTRALVLRVWEHRESDRLVHLFTEQLGRIAAIAKGARRSRKRFPGTLEILTVLEIRVVDPPRASLLRLESARLLQPFERFSNDLPRYALACHVAEILERLSGEREASPELFRFALGVLDVLAAERIDALLALLVGTKLLARLGFRPQLARCAVCGEPLGEDQPAAFSPREGGAVCAACSPGKEGRVPARLLLGLEAGLRLPLSRRGELGLGPADLEQADRLLERFSLYHVDVQLRSRAFLRDILRGGRCGPRDPGGRPRGSPDPIPSHSGVIPSGSGHL